MILSQRILMTSPESSMMVRTSLKGRLHAAKSRFSSSTVTMRSLGKTLTVLIPGTSRSSFQSRALPNMWRSVRMAQFLLWGDSLNFVVSTSSAVICERVSNNIGEASDEHVSRLVLTEHVIVTIPADTSIYVVLENRVRTSTARALTTDSPPLSSSTSTDELRQLLQLQRELNQPRANNEK